MFISLGFSTSYKWPRACSHYLLKVGSSACTVQSGAAESLHLSCGDLFMAVKFNKQAVSNPLPSSGCTARDRYAPQGYDNTHSVNRSGPMIRERAEPDVANRGE